jgi:predicted kinase
MEAVIFVGIQASGKSTFYRERFFDTHVRINLDMLRTRRRERLLLEACIEGKQRFVVDNTCATAEERARYLAPALAARFTALAYFFVPDPRGSVARNAARARQVPASGIFGTLKRLEPPTAAEGFHQLHRVLLRDGLFVVEELDSHRDTEAQR